MSNDEKRELVNAFLAGRVTRRSFMAKLAAAGVGLGAAIAYGELLSPSEAFGKGRRGKYPDPYTDYEQYNDHRYNKQHPTTTLPG